VHAGLLVLFRYTCVSSKILLAAVALYITFITQRMYRRAHNFILLRKAQAMLIERNLAGMEGGKIRELLTKKGALTTFSREHAAFLSGDKLDKKNPKNKGDKEMIPVWNALRKEIEDLGAYPARPFTEQFLKRSMGHKMWFENMCYTLYVLWGGIIVFEGGRPVVGLLTSLTESLKTFFTQWDWWSCF